MSRVRNSVPSPLYDNSRKSPKKTRAEYKHSSTPGEAFKLLELRPNSSLKGKTPQELLDHLSLVTKRFGKSLCLPYLLKGLQFKCPNHDTCPLFHLDGKKLPPHIKQRPYSQIKKWCATDKVSTNFIFTSGIISDLRNFVA